MRDVETERVAELILETHCVFKSYLKYYQTYQNYQTFTCKSVRKQQEIKIQISRVKQVKHQKLEAGWKISSRRTFNNPDFVGNNWKAEILEIFHSLEKKK